ncbi:MAG: TFIIB-type zinc ribbon-containing protein, partial [Ruminococcus sp.]|nr:TFIIB-type zinc ribbon-containing protein [Ruminococcus sp.]
MATMEYKCPSCGAPLSFNPEKQNFACDYCGSEFTVQHIQSLYAQSEKTESINEQEVRQSEEQRAQAQKTGREFNEDFMVSYSCPSCGAEIMTAESTAATECYYCGNPVVLGSRLSGEFKPDSVIPFALTKDMAVDAFMKMCGKKKFLPAGFANKKQFEKMQGVYFPYWYVDEKMQSSAVATGKKVRHWTSGNRRYTETSTYRLFRTGDIEIRNVFEEALRDKQGAPTEKPQTNRQANAQEAMKYLDNYHMQQRHEMLQCVHPFDVN